MLAVLNQKVQEMNTKVSRENEKLCDERNILSRKINVYLSVGLDKLYDTLPKMFKEELKACSVNIGREHSNKREGSVYNLAWLNYASHSSARIEKSRETGAFYCADAGIQKKLDAWISLKVQLLIADEGAASAKLIGDFMKSLTE